MFPFSDGPPLGLSTFTPAQPALPRYEAAPIKPLMTISSVFPFELFPSQVLVNEHKITIILKPFFLSHIVHSILIASIKDLKIESNMFFATFIIIPDGNPGDPVVVKYLRKKEALYAQEIIQNFMIKTNEKKGERNHTSNEYQTQQNWN